MRIRKSEKAAPKSVAISNFVINPRGEVIVAKDRKELKAKAADDAKKK